jgi:hypothetical protein
LCLVVSYYHPIPYQRLMQNIYVTGRLMSKHKSGLTGYFAG